MNNNPSCLRTSKACMRPPRVCVSPLRACLQHLKANLRSSKGLSEPSEKPVFCLGGPGHGFQRPVKVDKKCYDSSEVYKTL